MMDWTFSSGVLIAPAPKAVPLLLLNSHTGQGLDKYPEHRWVPVDLPEEIPEHENIVAVEIALQLIITQASTTLTNLTVAFRKPGWNEPVRRFDGSVRPLEGGTPGDYQGQAVAVFSGDGRRSPYSVAVPVVDRQVEMYWTCTVPEGQYPRLPAFAINASVEKVFLA